MNLRERTEQSIKADGIDDDHEGVELMARMQAAERAGHEHAHELDETGTECWFCGCPVEDFDDRGQA